MRSGIHLKTVFGFVLLAAYVCMAPYGVRVSQAEPLAEAPFMEDPTLLEPAGPSCPAEASGQRGMEMAGHPQTQVQPGVAINAQGALNGRGYNYASGNSAPQLLQYETRAARQAAQ